MSRSTKIAGRDVLIEPGEVITVNFSRGSNPGDVGPKDFWTAFNDQRKTTVR